MSGGELVQRILVILLSLILVFCSAAQAFAAAPVALGVDFFSTLVTAYLSAAGLDLLLQPSDVPSSSSDPASSAVYELLTTGLYQEFVDSSGSTLTSLDSFRDTYYDSVEVMQGVNNEVILRLSDSLTFELDRIGNWLLRDKYQLNANSTDSGFVHSSGSFASPVVSSMGDLSVSGILIPTAYEDINIYSTRHIYNLVSSSPVYLYKIGGSFRASSDSPFSFDVGYDYGASSYAWEGKITGLLSSSSTDFFKYNSVAFATGTPLYIPNLTGIVSSNFISVDDVTVSSNDTLGTRVKPSHRSKDIAIPNVDSDVYLPAPKDLTLDIPYAPDFAGSLGLDNLLDVTVDKILTNELTATDAIAIDQDLPLDPSGFSPFLPAKLPSFNFNLSGIWHYVVDWVGTLRSGSSTLFSVWQSLPAALVLPVYASAVVVIVIGVWKRFL